MKCTACGGALIAGFIPDIGHAQTWLAVWVAGAPATAKGLWDRIQSAGGVMMEGVDAAVIDAHRCVSCGHLELYATRRPEPGTTPRWG
jgi:hypothetical protein